MPQKEIFVSVIIPTFNRFLSLEKTINSFIKQEFDHNFEIIISDNNSTDRTEDLIKNKIKNSSKVPIIYHKEKQQGVHFARNSASKLARGEILYFTDDDMEADKLLLAELIKIFKNEPRLGSATGVILPRFESVPPKWVTRNLINHFLSLSEKKLVNHLLITEDEPQIGIYSCHQAIRKKAFIEAGGFLPENTKGIWLGNGETGLNIKLFEKNWLFGFTNKSIIYHNIPRHRTTLKYVISRSRNQAYADSYTQFRKHRNLKIHLFNFLIRNIMIIPKLTLHFLRSIIRKRSFRLLLGRIFYGAARNSYDLKILKSDKFRKLVCRDNWL